MSGYSVEVQLLKLRFCARMEYSKLQNYSKVQKKFCFFLFITMWSPLIRRHLFNHLLWSVFQSSYMLPVSPVFDAEVTASLRVGTSIPQLGYTQNSRSKYMNLIQKHNREQTQACQGSCSLQPFCHIHHALQFIFIDHFLHKSFINIISCNVESHLK